MILPKNEGAFRKLVYRYKKHAEKCNREFDLTDDQLRILFKGNCYYCGTEPNQVCEPSGAIDSSTGKPMFNGISVLPFIYNGIDRKDNSQGYTIKNCVSCCKTCNRIKYNRQSNEMINPNQQYGNYLTIRKTDKRKNGHVIWECLHNNQIKEVTSGHLRVVDKRSKRKQVN